MNKKISMIIIGIMIIGLCGCQNKGSAAQSNETASSATEKVTDVEDTEEYTEATEETKETSNEESAAAVTESATSDSTVAVENSQTTTVQVEGNTETVPAKTVNGSYGYSITYDSSRFTFGTAEGADTITPISEDTASVGNVYMAMSQITEYNLADTVAGLILQTDYEGNAEDITIGTNAYPAKTFFYQEGDGPQAMIREYYCVENKDGVLLIEIGFPSEAAEGYGARLGGILDTLTLD